MRHRDSSTTHLWPAGKKAGQILPGPEFATEPFNMTINNPLDGSTLITEGLSSYWDARFAMRVFEDTVQEAASAILTVNLTILSEACRTDLQEKQIWLVSPEADCRLGQVIIGAAYPCEWGARLGVGWRSSIESKKTKQ
jgi:hypothetical protein